MLHSSTASPQYNAIQHWMHQVHQTQNAVSNLCWPTVPPKKRAEEQGKHNIILTQNTLCKL